MDRDRTQAVCECCYGLLIHGHRGKAKTATSARAHRELAKQQPMSKTERRQLEKEKDVRRQLERERQELRRQLPGLDGLLAFLLAPGSRAEPWPGTGLWINGAHPAPPAH